MKAIGRRIKCGFCMDAQGFLRQGMKDCGECEKVKFDRTGRVASARITRRLRVVSVPAHASMLTPKMIKTRERRRRKQIVDAALLVAASELGGVAK